MTQRLLICESTLVGYFLENIAFEPSIKHVLIKLLQQILNKGCDIFRTLKILNAQCAPTALKI